MQSSTRVTNKFKEELQKVRSQLEAQKTSWDELPEELENSEAIRGELRSELADLQKTCDKLRSELADLKQKSKIDAASKNFPDFPEAADLLNQLKARRKKSRADLADMQVVLGLLGRSGG
ncbi:flagellar alpha dynein [Microcoleus sp. herbarium14]|uniref:flagellar alpha dynein n=1 Tax=Microcoleus sp. herbarium14 TaxID=3055439 RepID=UPI002FCFBC14